MRLLLLNQFYPPDPAPTGVYLRDLALSLVQRGHEVDVLCSRRGYDGGADYDPETVEDGVRVRRLGATGFGRRGFIVKIADYATFSASLAAAVIRVHPRPDLVVALTTPPYVGLTARMAARRFRMAHAHWVMDLYPDVLHAHGLVGSRGMLAAMLRQMTRFQFLGASAVIALGPIMAERVGRYCRGSNRRPWADSRLACSTRSGGVEAIPLWAPDDLQGWVDGRPNPLRAQRGWGQQELVFLYSGNMGLGHRLGEFLETARRLGSAGPRWVFSGGGKRRREVEAFQAANSAARIELLDYVPSKLLNAHLCAADVHLASLDREWQGMMVPSKLQASFAVGRPVLFVGPRDNETARWIDASGGGWVVAENDLDGLAQAVQEAADPAVRRRRGGAARAFAREHFDRTRNCSRMMEILTGQAVRTDDRRNE